MMKDKAAARAYARAYYAGRKAARIAERERTGWKDKRTGPRTPASDHPLGEAARAARRAYYANPSPANRAKLRDAQRLFWREVYYPAHRARILAAQRIRQSAARAAGTRPAGKPGKLARSAARGAVPLPPPAGAVDLPRHLAEAARAARALSGLIGRTAGTAAGLAEILEALARRAGRSGETPGA